MMLLVAASIPLATVAPIDEKSSSRARPAKSHFCLFVRFVVDQSSARAGTVAWARDREAVRSVGPY
jgi:hypothetical protein